MKYFSCQPDSHNAFGSLTNGVLTYFTVDCARYQRLSRGIGVVDKRESDALAFDTPQMAPVEGVSHTAIDAGTSPAPKSLSKGRLYSAFLREPHHEPHFSTDTRMHIQRTLTLPSAFQATQCCFSMANRTVFGADMAFVGAANGLLALVVLREDLLLYVCGKDPQSLREEWQRGQRENTASATSAPRHSAATNAATSHHCLGVPTTITWMRDKPLVLVGYSTGRVEWYRVSLSPARQQELMDPATELPFGPSVTPGAFAYRALNRDVHTSRVAHVVVGGHKDGLRIEMVARCHVPEAGALVSSDYFPANGTVAVGGERGGLYLFHTDQLEAPLCELNIRTPTAGFLYCHPFLPLVGIVSTVVWTAEEETTRSRQQQQQHQATASPTRVQRAGSRPEQDAAPRVRSSSVRRGQPTQQANSRVPSMAEMGKPDRHVGWRDDDDIDNDVYAAAASRNVSALARAAGAPSAPRASSFVGGETARSGCVVTLVEYTKEAPPRQLARAWTGDQPLSPTHRLTQVLQHWIDGASPRYGTYYNFSWKFSFDLELVVANLEEGALRVVRFSRVATTTNAAAAAAAGAATATHAVSLMQEHRGKASGAAAVAGAEDTGYSAGAEREGSSTATSTTDNAAAAATSSGAAHVDGYRVVQEYNVRLPLHSLVNVEYVSAATSALSGLDAPVLEGGSGGSVVAFEREAERHRRRSAFLAAAAQAATDPRTRLGFSAGAPGLLCRPVNAFWAGLAVVSLPRHPRHLSTATGNLGCGAELVPATAPFDSGLLDAFYDGGGGSGGGGVQARMGGGVCAVGGGLQLKENVLAAAMLQPLRGEFSGARRHRRHGADATSSSSGLPAGTDATSSSRLQSSSSTSTQLQSPRRRRRDRDPLAPAITVPSYAAARSTQNEIANAVLIAADHRVDLHQRLRIGAGNVSCVVGMNAAGEVASVPVEVRAVATWHEEGSVFVGLGPTTCAADLVSIQGIERLMRRRHAAGFGVSAVANLAAAKKVGGYGSEDVVLWCTYVATLERVGVAAATGAVPSLMELLRGSSLRSRRVSTDILKTQPRLAPRLRAAMQGCVFHGDLRRLLVLQVLGWLPPSVAAEWRSSPAAATAPDVPEWLHLPFEASPTLDESSTNTEVERAAAVEVTHARYTAAAELLLRFAHRSPSYRAMATLLLCPAEALVLVRESDTRVSAAFRASLTPWLLVVFLCLCSVAGKRKEGTQQQQQQQQPRNSTGVSSGAKVSSLCPPQTALPRELYRHPSLFLWDRVALAVVMEDDVSGALAHVLRDVVLPQCNPLQALLLHHGIHLRTCPVMQEIVDCTGDFQLGACLFARVGVLTTAAALAFPFLLDGVGQISATGAAAAEGLNADGAAMNAASFVQPGSHDESVSAHRFHALLPDTRYGEGDEDEAADGEGGSLRERSNNSNLDGDGSALNNNSSLSSSPYAYLYGGTSQHSSRRASPHAASANASRGAFDGGVSHTARLVRNSALPPPPLPLSPLPASDEASSRVRASSSSHPNPVGRKDMGHPPCTNEGTDAVAARTAGTKEGGWAALYREGEARIGTDTEGSSESSEVEVDDDDAYGDAGQEKRTDEPWVWWAAAYRSFLDDEQAFVRRTTFDVECQQLRSHAAASASARNGVLPFNAELPNRNRQSRSSSDGGAAARTYGPSFHHAPSLRDLDGLGHRVITSSDGGRLSLAAAHRTSGRVPQLDGSLSPTPLSVSLAFPYSAAVVPRSYGRLGGFFQGELVVGSHAGGAAAAAAGDGTTAQDCVCGERHEGTQLIRSLLNLCCTTTTRCSVCLQPVRLGSCDVSWAFAWCTACRHGGHAHHLQEWFRTHRRCPVNGCDCHCDEDSSLF